MIDNQAMTTQLTAEATENLETELRERSDAIERHKTRFRQLSEELRRRRETKDEQPVLLTEEQETQKRRDAALDLERNLVLKVTAMEAEQAKLVVEAEIAKAAQREAEERLALVAKHVDKQIERKALTRDEAIALISRHATKPAVPQTPIGWTPPNWIVELVIEASR